MSGSDITLRYLLFGEDRSASSSIKGVETTANRSQKVIGASFSKMGGLIGGEVGDLVNRVGEGLTSLGESAKGMGAKMAASGGVVAGLGTGLSLLGSKDKEADAALAASFRDAGKSVDNYQGKIKSVIKQQENYGHSAADTSQALATLTSMTKNPEKALASMGLVANLAAAQHIDLNSAATLVGRGINGNVKLFKQYGISVTSTTAAQAALTKAQAASATAGAKYQTDLKNYRMAQQSVAHGEVTGAEAKKLLSDMAKNLSKSTADLAKKHAALAIAQRHVKDATDQQKTGFDELAKRVDGRASASVASFGGHLEVLKTKILDGAAAFGNKFGPALQIGGTTLMAVGTVLEIVRGRQAAAAAATAADTVAIEGQSVASKAAAAAQWLLNAAMDANPVLLIVTALLGLVAVFVLLYKHSTTFRNAMNAAFHAVTEAALFAFNWIKQHWPLILAILTGPFGIAVLLIVKHWSSISSAAGTAIAWIKNAWNGFMGFLGSISGKIGSIAGSMWSGIGSAFRGMINGIIDIWNGLHFTLPKIHAFGVSVGGGTIGVPHIPHMASGGTLTRAGAVMVGENGPEYLHLPTGAQVRPLSAGPGGGAGGDVHVSAPLVLKLDSRVVWQGMLQMKRNSGLVTLGLG